MPKDIINRVANLNLGNVQAQLISKDIIKETENIKIVYLPDLLKYYPWDLVQNFPWTNLKLPNWMYKAKYQEFAQSKRFVQHLVQMNSPYIMVVHIAGTRYDWIPLIPGVIRKHLQYAITSKLEFNAYPKGTAVAGYIDKVLEKLLNNPNLALPNNTLENIVKDMVRNDQYKFLIKAYKYLQKNSTPNLRKANKQYMNLVNSKGTYNNTNYDNLACCNFNWFIDAEKLPNSFTIDTSSILSRSDLFKISGQLRPENPYSHTDVIHFKRLPVKLSTNTHEYTMAYNLKLQQTMPANKPYITSNMIIYLNPDNHRSYGQYDYQAYLYDEDDKLLYRI